MNNKTKMITIKPINVWVDKKKEPTYLDKLRKFLQEIKYCLKVDSSDECLKLYNIIITEEEKYKGVLEEDINLDTDLPIIREVYMYFLNYRRNWISISDFSTKILTNKYIILMTLLTKIIEEDTIDYFIY